MKIIIPSILFCLFSLLLVRAGAGTVSEQEPNNSFDTAQYLDPSLFTTAPNPNVFSAQTTPWVSLSGTGDATFDYYSFDVFEPDIVASVFDMDRTNFDTELFLFDADKNFLAQNDDNYNLDPGSISVYDSLLQYTFTNPGRYIIVVGKFNSWYNSEIRDVNGLPPQQGDFYTLHISLDSYSAAPSDMPSDAPSDAPSDVPSDMPSMAPTMSKKSSKGKGSMSRHRSRHSMGKGSSISNSGGKSGSNKKDGRFRGKSGSNKKGGRFRVRA